ncbi:hypothetical protein F0M18_13475 [Pseudohalioglobus sediminis]|uniref:Uncharacterized protein n=1 Tax=Pseudohalioglobus sediminis TaxID=2606449 RepID=A0A5B0WSM5_9GAMM|nr:haloacid dehalogenase-like hydrolase [Pseudohalioglobus sediminis]KAA1190072.1 hypothetical protein F0M18_13475 [Pseudohalioglobus sediminis]
MPAPVRGGPNEPLVVDLDGTLIREDMLRLALVDILRKSPTRLPTVLLGLAGGRVEFKKRAALAAVVDPARLSYNQRVLQLVRAARQHGREVVLATGSHRLPAALVAEYLGLFDSVLASEGPCNMKGPAKAEALVARYGLTGFDYVGNSHADIPVWQCAQRGFLVNADAGLESRLRRLKLNVEGL